MYKGPYHLRQKPSRRDLSLKKWNLWTPFPCLGVFVNIAQCFRFEACHPTTNAHVRPSAQAAPKLNSSTAFHTPFPAAGRQGHGWRNAGNGGCGPRRRSCQGCPVPPTLPGFHAHRARTASHLPSLLSTSSHQVLNLCQRLARSHCRANAAEQLQGETSPAGLNC